jgi:hypothetical protein
MPTAIIKIPKHEAKYAKKLLKLSEASPDGKECSTLIEWSANFKDGFEAVIQVCNGDVGPWTQTILYDDRGNEVHFTEAGEDFLGEVEFEDEGKIYRVLSKIG